MKNKLAVFLLFILVVLNGFSAYLLYQKNKEAIDDFFGGSTPTRFDVIGTEASPTYLDDANSTTTHALEVGAEMDLLTLDLYANASGTETLIMEVYGSNDSGCGSSTDSTITWFQRAYVADSSSAATINASSTYYWTFPAQGEHESYVTISNWNHRCAKITVGNNKQDTGEQGAASSTGVWVEANFKEQN